MSYHDVPYLTLVDDVLRNGVQKGDRTGTGTISVFDRTMRFDLSDGTVPLLTTKKVFTRMNIHELLWYIAGDTNVKYLVDNNTNIWNEWPCVAWLKKTGQEVPPSDSEEWKQLLGEFAAQIRSDQSFALNYGDLGPVYGGQWRSWRNIVGGTIDYDTNPNPSVTLTDEPIDQLAEVIESIKTNPNCRRMIVNSWNVGQLKDMALPPCHYSFQFYTAPMHLHERVKVLYTDPKYQSESVGYGTLAPGTEEQYLDSIGVPTLNLSCKLTQRSADVGLGVPFNIVQYSMLTRMIAEVTGTHAKEFIWSGGDVHIYNNHIDALKGQLLVSGKKSPRLSFARKVEDINDFTFDDFVISNYDPGEAIKMDVAV
jgi:thymidylate synthase